MTTYWGYTFQTSYLTWPLNLHSMSGTSWSSKAHGWVSSLYYPILSIYQIIYIHVRRCLWYEFHVVKNPTARAQSRQRHDTDAARQWSQPWFSTNGPNLRRWGMLTESGTNQRCPRVGTKVATTRTTTTTTTTTTSQLSCALNMSFWSTPRSCCNGKQMLAKIPKASKSIKVNQSTVTVATSADFPAPCDFIHETCWHQLVDLVIWSTDPRSRATAAVCWNSLELCHWIL